MKSLRERISEFTIGLNNEKVVANIQVKKTAVKRNEYLEITVNDVNEDQSKQACFKISSYLLDSLGYGTSATEFKDNTLTFVYTPIATHKPKKSLGERFGNVVDSLREGMSVPAGGVTSNDYQR